MEKNIEDKTCSEKSPKMWISFHAKSQASAFESSTKNYSGKDSTYYYDDVVAFLTGLVYPVINLTHFHK